MRFDRRFGDVGFVGDLLVELAVAQHLQDAEFLRGEFADAARDVVFFAAGGGCGRRCGRRPTIAGQNMTDAFAELRRIGGFRQKPDRAVIERAAHGRRVLARGNDHHRQLQMQGAQMHERAEALRAGHVEIEQSQNGVGFALWERVERVDVLGFVQHRAGNRPQHRAAQGFAEQRVIVGE